MIDVVNKQNASILIQAIDLPPQPITMWAFGYPFFQSTDGAYPPPPLLCFLAPKNVQLKHILNSCSSGPVGNNES